MNQFTPQWQKLIAQARLAPRETDAQAPLGFATRVASRAMMLPLSPWAAFERFALRGLVVAAALAVTAMAFHFTTGMNEPADAYATTDTIGELLDLS
jgi:hypothetical protein